MTFAAGLGNRHLAARCRSILTMNEQPRKSSHAQANLTGGQILIRDAVLTWSLSGIALQLSKHMDQLLLMHDILEDGDLSELLTDSAFVCPAFVGIHCRGIFPTVSWPTYKSCEATHRT